MLKESNDRVVPKFRRLDMFCSLVMASAALSFTHEAISISSRPDSKSFSGSECLEIVEAFMDTSEILVLGSFGSWRSTDACRSLYAMMSPAVKLGICRWLTASSVSVTVVSCSPDVVELSPTVLPDSKLFSEAFDS